MDPEDEGKVLVQEVFASVKTQMRLLPQAGVSLRSKTLGIFGRSRRPVEGGAD
jgi:hypothetical protein